MGRTFASRPDRFYEESEQLVPWVGAAFKEASEAERAEAERAEDEPALDSLGEGAKMAAEGIGTLVDRSQELTATHLCNTLEETEWLPAAARRLGAHAASAFGAGFGGSVWALAAAKEADALLQAWEREYAQQYPQRTAQARFFAMRSPAPGARSVG